jgi:hypothetical protein
MYCPKCGVNLAPETAFCNACGEKIAEVTNAADTDMTVKDADTTVKDAGTDLSGNAVQAAPVYPEQAAPVYPEQNAPGNKNKGASPLKPVIIAVCCLVVIGVVAYIFLSGSRSGGTLSGTYNTTVKAYSGEIDTFVKQNEVLKTASDLISASHTQTLSIEDYYFDLNVTLHHDAKEGVFAAELRTDEIPIRLEMYITDDAIIFGSRSIMYVEADPSNLGADISAFINNNDLWFDDSIIDMLNDYDFSYSSLTAGTVHNKFDTPAFEKSMRKSVSNVYEGLLNKGEFIETDVQIEIGGKMEPAERVVLRLDNDSVAQWLQVDVKNELLANKDLEELFDFLFEDIYYALPWYIRMGMSPVYDYRDFVDNLDYIADEIMDLDDFICDFGVIKYKGVVVEVSFRIEVDGEEFELTAGAVGEKFRLNDLYLKAFDNGETVFALTAEGDHIGRDVFTSTIEFTEYGYTDSVDIEWDTKETSNNFTIRTAYDRFRFTVAKDGDKVVVSQNIDYPYFSWTIAPLEQSVSVPSNTVNIKDVNMFEIISALGVLGF